MCTVPVETMAASELKRAAPTSTGPGDSCCPVPVSLWRTKGRVHENAPLRFLLAHLPIALVSGTQVVGWLLRYGTWFGIGAITGGPIVPGNIDSGIIAVGGGIINGTRPIGGGIGGIGGIGIGPR